MLRTVTRPTGWYDVLLNSPATARKRDNMVAGKLLALLPTVSTLVFVGSLNSVPLSQAQGIFYSEETGNPSIVMLSNPQWVYCLPLSSALTLRLLLFSIILFVVRSSLFSMSSSVSPPFSLILLPILCISKFVVKA